MSRDAEAIVARARAAGATVVPVTGPVLDRLAYGDRAEGVVATVAIPDLSLATLRLAPDALVVVLEGVEKPGNLGAVLRSADGAGADAVIAADPRTDLFNPNAVRASLGHDLHGAARRRRQRRRPRPARAAGIRIVAARVEGAVPYTDLDLRGPVAHRPGQRGGRPDRRLDRRRTSSRSSLPMLGVADSLNVSIAAAVLLYEARRQRGAPAPHPLTGR